MVFSYWPLVIAYWRNNIFLTHLVSVNLPSFPLPTSLSPLHCSFFTLHSSRFPLRPKLTTHNLSHWAPARKIYYWRVVEVQHLSPLTTHYSLLTTLNSQLLIENILFKFLHDFKNRFHIFCWTILLIFPTDNQALSSTYWFAHLWRPK